MNQPHAPDPRSSFIIHHSPLPPSVAIIGGGIAGPAAAVRLAEQGLKVELFEARPRLGGRAASFFDAESRQWVDCCQHVALGCCTELADLCRRTGMAGCFERHRRLHFFGPDGRRSDFAPAAWLPAPLHLLPALFSLRYLSWHDRLHIARTMMRLGRDRRVGQGCRVGRAQRAAPGPGANQLVGLAALDPPYNSFLAWLRDQGTSEAAVRGFWSVVLQSALAETADRASFAAARKVFVDGLLASRDAYELLVPTLPLVEIFDRRLGQWLAERGVALHRGRRVRRIEGDGGRATALVLAEGEPRREFDFFVVAVPWHRLGNLLAPPLADAIPAVRGLAQIEPAPIHAIHLWFDRPITELPHAVLVGRLGQWVFADAMERIAGQAPPLRGCHHYQVVISGSRELLRRPREEVLAEVHGELRSLWPAARAARLIRWRLVAEPAAAFSMRPGIERLRPPQQTPVANLALCGDWTDTGWPATMESAVRSGYAAAEAVGNRQRAEGRGQRAEGGEA